MNPDERPEADVSGLGWEAKFRVKLLVGTGFSPLFLFDYENLVIRLYHLAILINF